MGDRGVRSGALLVRSSSSWYEIIKTQTYKHTISPFQIDLLVCIKDFANLAA